MRQVRLKNIPFRVESSCVRAWYRATGLRPGSAPFVSGDSFRAISNHVVEKGHGLDPTRVRKGDVVFVEAWQLSSFAESCLPRIREPFVLITHNGDLNIDKSFLPVAEDRRIMRWFAQNALLRHPKVIAVPIGLENRFHHCNGVVNDYEKLARGRSQKSMRILYGFTVGTNEKERKPAFEALRASSLTDHGERTNSREYRFRLGRYAFVASPPGNGEDCHRTWEGLYLRVVPIVKRSVLYESFPGLPVLEIGDWAEIKAWDASFLSTIYGELSHRIESTPYLRFDYWADLIHRARSGDPS